MSKTVSEVVEHFMQPHVMAQVVQHSGTWFNKEGQTSNRKRTYKLQHNTKTNVVRVRYSEGGPEEEIFRDELRRLGYRFQVSFDTPDKRFSDDIYYHPETCVGFFLRACYAE